tara:strand:+ start:5328 stop:5609 length:282 start_codon:yes stop_codon:yes gene_type:complete
MKNIINFILLLLLLSIIILDLFFELPILGKILYDLNPNIVIGLQKTFETSIDFIHLPQMLDSTLINFLNLSISIFGYIIIVLALFLYNIWSKK